MKTPNWFLYRNLIAYILWPLAVIYGLVSKIVFSFRKVCAKKVPGVFIICIGGVMAGGVGKTPIVREIAKKIPNSAVVMRGYKGGDEARMLADSGIRVFTGKNRFKNIKRAKKACCDVVIMDDGFQNPTIAKDLSILVFDANLGIGNGFVLPAGPLRESVKSALRRADAVVIIRQKAKSKRQKEFEKSLSRYRAPIFYADNKTVVSADCAPLVAFAGIGYPKKFFDGLPIKPDKTFAFPDHYQYTKSDLDKLEKVADSIHAHLITTEKDFVRLPKKFQKKVIVAKLQTTLESKFWRWLDANAG